MNVLARTLGLAAWLLGSGLAAQAQQRLAIKELGLRPRSDSQTAVYCGASKSAAIRVLGTPTKTSRYFYEIENAWATVLH